MGRRFNAIFGAVCVLSLTVASASQVTFTARELVQRRILSDLKQAQESAGIFVDDSDLFLNPHAHTGRKLLQASELTQILSNPTVATALVGLFSNGSTVGGFPGAGLNLPGGSPFGYAPTGDSYCLFSTSNQSSSTATVAAPPGALPSTFTCTEANVAAPGGFLVSYDGASYSCVSTSGPGRKLLQSGFAASPALTGLLSEQFIGSLAEDLLSAIGLPVWNCITATTPEGNTTVGDTTLAVLNDLGVIAEHFLVALNGNGELSYAQNVQNNFVSLANPLYPSGPRLNISIDFSKVAGNQALFREIFGFPLPPSPPPPAPVTTVAPALATPVTPTTGGTVPAGTTPTTTTSQASASSTSQGSAGGSQATSGGSQATGSSQATTGGSVAPSGGSQATSGSTTTSTPSTAPPATPSAPPPAATLTAFDGYLSNCQVVLGSYPGTDGNFQKIDGFQAVILNGVSNMAMNATSQYNGSVSYIIPSSKTVEYPALTQATASQAQFCYDIATLLPVYNPLATVITPNVSGMAANAITTVAIFGQALGATAADVIGSLGINIPAPDTLWTYNALAQAANGSSTGLAFLQTNSAVQNLVTSGANMLTNDSAVYASYAIIMNQAVAQKVLYSPASSVAVTGRKLLQAATPPAVDLTNATTVASILNIANTIAQANQDPTTKASLNAGLTQDQMSAVATAIANLNAATNNSTNPSTTQLSTLYGEDYLADHVADLATGAESTSDFNTATSQSSISQALAGTLPGSILPTPSAPAVTPAASQVTPQTQSSTSSSSSDQKKSGGGLSHGGKVALATVFPIVGVIVIVAIAAVLIRRRNSQGESTSSNVWYRRPFARSAGQSVA